MSVIATTNFHTHNARQFVESLSETANDVYYIFIGRPSPWADGDGDPNTPEDSNGNTAFGFWNDMLAMRRITSDDLQYVVPRHNWAVDTKYAMFDHRVPMSTLISNASPFFVYTDTADVFKCIYNGQANSTSGPSNSTSQPTISGQTDISALTYADGDPKDYAWKYLYSTTGYEKFVTNAYIPVIDLSETLDANGDISDDSSLAYDVFNTARTTANGAILQIVVTNQGSGYTNEPSITITGDGTAAEASATISSGQVTQINMASVGTDYSHATVTISANGDSGSGATATAILSPRSGFTNSSGLFYKTSHGINLVEELGAKAVMLYVEFAGTGDDNELSTGNDYRRIGIVRNPQLYGNTEIATGNGYSLTTDLTLANISGGFNDDEIVWQESTNAYGVIVERSGSTLKLVNVSGTFAVDGTTTILGIGNGNTTGMVANVSVTIPSTPEAFTPVVAPSGATADVSAITLPGINPYSGTILYVDHRVPVTRSPEQTEYVRTILTF